MHAKRGIAALLISGILVITVRHAVAAETNLLQLAREHFTNGLTLAEITMFESASSGRVALYVGEGDDDPVRSDSWGTNRVIRADRLAWLCTDPVASALVNYRGISISGARIEGILDLSWANIPFPLQIVKCAFGQTVNLRASRLRALNLTGTHVKDLLADGLKVENDVFLHQGFKAEGEVRLAGASVGGTLGCDGGQSVNPNGDALNFDGARIKNGVFLRGFRAEGGVRFTGAIIDGDLECTAGRFVNATSNGFALFANKAQVNGSINLKEVEAHGIVSFSYATIGAEFACTAAKLFGSNGSALIADGVKIEGQVSLDKGFMAEGEVRFGGASVGSNLGCEAGQFSNAGATAFYADGATIKGAVALRHGFKATGAVNLTRASIGLNLDCRDARIINPSGAALVAAGIKIGGDVFLSKGFHAEGEVGLQVATISGGLFCEDGHFVNTNGAALTASGATIEGLVLLKDGFIAHGGVIISDTAIGRSFSADGGQFFNTNGVALFAERLRPKGGVFLRYGFRAFGEVRLSDATIGGNLQCEGGRFVNNAGLALNAQGTRIDGSVFLMGVTSNGFWSEGEVRFANAIIGQSLECSKAQFNNPQRQAVNAAGVHIRGGAVFVGVVAYGEIQLTGGAVEGDLDCRKSRLFGTPKALSAEATKIDGNVALTDDFEAHGPVTFAQAKIGSAFVYSKVQSPENAVLILISANAGMLYDDEKSWPANGNLFLDGFTYERIFENSPRDAATRINWLQRQPKDQFFPQPYEQLAKVLKQMGHDDAADEVMIEKNKSSASWFWYHIGWLVGYGYVPMRAFWFSALCLIVGSCSFRYGKRQGLITPTDFARAYSTKEAERENRLSEDYPNFSALVYSLETFVPLLNLDMAQHWRPNSGRSAKLVLGKMRLRISGRFLYGCLVIYKILGWVLTTLWLGALTGLVKT
jgi:hypothetical protein